MALSANVLYSIESCLGFIRLNIRNIFPKVNEQSIYIVRMRYHWKKAAFEEFLGKLFHGKNY